MPHYDIITFGSATQDVFLMSPHGIPQRILRADTRGECFAFGSKIEIDDIVFDVGGGGTNTSVACAYLGFSSAVVTRVGKDSFGPLIREQIRKKGVDDGFISVDPQHATCYSTILVSPHGERTIFVYRGASREWQVRAVPWRRLRAPWFYVATVAGDVTFLRAIIRHAKRIGARIAWNPGGREIGRGMSHLDAIIRRVDYLQMNREEAARLTGYRREQLDHIFKKLIAYAVPLLAVTDGSSGVYIIKDHKVWHAPALPVRAINTTGAGDAFGAGVVAGLMRHGDDWKNAVRIGLVNSAGVVMITGAQKGLLKRWPSEKKLAVLRLNAI